MGDQALRFPGGSLSDDYHWATNTTNGNTWQWATSFDNFAQVATTIGAQVFVTANYGSGTPAEAAAWVRASNVTNRYGFKYWEIGNENYGSWETDTNTRPHDPFTYAQRFKDYYTQMKAVDPTIKVGAVAITGEESYANYTDHPALNTRTGQSHNGWTPVMLATMRSLGVTPDFLIYHRYAQTPGAESDQGLLLSSSTWSTDAADLRQQLNDYLGATAPGVELDCTENNSVYSNPGKQTTSLVNGLFLADSICAAMGTEFNSVVWWDMRNGQETTNNNSSSLYGWRPYGDYGIADSADPAGPSDPYPTFYVDKLLQHFARGGDELIRSVSDYPMLSVCAAQRTNGMLALLAVNKDREDNSTQCKDQPCNGVSAGKAPTPYILYWYPTRRRGKDGGWFSRRRDRSGDRPVDKFLVHFSGLLSQYHRIWRQRSNFANVDRESYCDTHICGDGNELHLRANNNFYGYGNANLDSDCNCNHHRNF